MRSRQLLLHAAVIFACGYYTSAPPLAGIGFVLLPIILWLQREHGLWAPWYGLEYFLGVGAKIPLAVIDVGSGFDLALTIWIGYGLVGAWCSRLPRFVRSSTQISVWAFLPLSLPLIGFIFVAPPLSAAGWLYPATGIIGVGLLLALGANSIRSVLNGQLRPLALPLALAIVLNLIQIDRTTTSRAPVSAISLRVPAPPHTLAQSIHAAIDDAPRVDDAFAAGAVVAVLPENVLGVPDPLTIAIMRIPVGHTLVAGGLAQDPRTGLWSKGTWVLPDRVFYPAIQPIPVIEPNFRAHWSAIGKTAEIHGTATSLLICFEASTSLPLYHLHRNTPALLLGNGWWDRSGIMDIEVGLAHSWARLFNSNISIARGLPLVRK